MREFNNRRSFDRPKRREFDRGDSDRPKRREFDRGDSDRPKRRDFRSRDRNLGEMTKVVCDKCGKSCEVPFRPTPGKPVYCNDCFGKNDHSSNRSGNNDRLDEINRKLDKILSLLD